MRALNQCGRGGQEVECESHLYLRTTARSEAEMEVEVDLERETRAWFADSSVVNYFYLGLFFDGLVNGNGVILS